MLLRVGGKSGVAADGKVNLFRRHSAFFGQSVDKNSDCLLFLYFVKAIKQAIIHGSTMRS